MTDTPPDEGALQRFAAPSPSGPARMPSGPLREALAVRAVYYRALVEEVP